MQQPGTPYIYVYDILYKAVIRINTSEIPVFVESRLELDSAYVLDYDMGQGVPGGQHGAYCMNKDATRIWYLFCDQGAYPVARNHPDAQLIEVDISRTVMRVVKKTLFPNLLPSEPFPDPNWGRINDGCSDNTHTYWCTDLVAGRTIKIRNSDHSIIDDHYFNYPIEGCGLGTFDEPIATIDYNTYNQRRAVCGNPVWQNMIRVYANHVLHHRSYHPSFDGHLMKRELDCIEEDEVEGTDTHRYACIKSHFAAVADKPITGGDWTTYWVRSAHSGGDVWSGGQSYTCSRVLLEYLQNIFGVKDGKLFTLMHVNSAEHPAFLHCINFSDMTELSNLDVSYYAGQAQLPTPWDWDWTSISAMNYQTGVIAIFRYHNLEERNYVGCFEAKQGLGFLCDVPLHVVRHTSSQELLNEPQSWPFEGFTPPEIPEEDPPIEIILPPDEEPGPGEIIYEPPAPPPDDAPDNVPQLYHMNFSDSWLFLNFSPGEVKFYKFFCPTTVDILDGWQISNTAQSQERKTVHILVKRASKPTMADFRSTWIMAPSYYQFDMGIWIPSKGDFNDCYWRYNTGSAAEFVEFNEPMGPYMFYVMLFNDGIRSIRNQRVILSIMS
jgi:hypothetical protein